MVETVTQRELLSRTMIMTNVRYVILCSNSLAKRYIVSSWLTGPWLAVLHLSNAAVVLTPFFGNSLY